MVEKILQVQEENGSWKHRDLTLEGKKLLVQAYIMSSMSYLVDIYTCNIPNVFIKQTK